MKFTIYEKNSIIDVREHFERDICHIEGVEYPLMNLIVESIDKISKDITTAACVTAKKKYECDTSFML